MFSFAAMVTILLRYKIVRSQLTYYDNDDVTKRRLALGACAIGMFGCVGLTLVANFPVSHIILRQLCLGTLYICTHTRHTIEIFIHLHEYFMIAL